MMEDKVPALYAAKAGKIKGHIKLELFDASTNALVQSTEADNLVTDAVGYTVTHLAACSSLSSGLPIATSLAGSIYLFDGELNDEASDFYFPPADAHITGFTNRSTNASSVFRGSLNSLESGATSTGYTSVWDFSTSQANGTIASAALTWNINSIWAPYGVTGVFNFYSSSGSNSFDCVPLYFDHDSDTMYFVTLSNSSSTFTANLYKERVPADRFCAGDAYPGSSTVTPTLCQTKTFTSSCIYKASSFLVLGHERYKWYFCCGYDGYTYIIYVSTSGGSTFYYMRMKLDTSDGEVDLIVEEDQAVTCSGCTFSKGAWAASNGYFYIPNTAMTIIYQIPMDNTANVKEITISSSGGYIVASVSASNNNIYALESQPTGGVRFTARSRSAVSGNYSYYRAFLWEDGTVFIDDTVAYTTNKSNDIQSYAYPINYMSDRLLGWGGYNNNRSKGYILRNFMATKANLGTSITKNATQTLKVTYTLTDS